MFKSLGTRKSVTICNTRNFAKKAAPANTTVKAEPQQQTQKSVHYPTPPHISDRLFPVNPRDVFVKREYDLDSEAQQALKFFVTESTAARNKILEKYPAVRPLLGPDYATEKAVFGDVALPPLRVAVTGAAGAIGYALLPRIASGAAFGPKRRIILHLLEIPSQMNVLKGVEMELRDSAFPLLEDVICTDNVEKAFTGVDYALLVGAQPRKAGMERGDLLLKNAEIFSIQGKALNQYGKGKDTRVAVVGNPANTNAMIAQRNAPKIPAENFMAMTKLDETRAIAQLAIKAKCTAQYIDGVIIWGNHSATQFPDISRTHIGSSKAYQVLASTIGNPEAVRKWESDEFIPRVQKRGAEIIAARGASSAASAASALVSMVRLWEFGTTRGVWTSGAVCSNGEYGVDKGLFFSYPILHDATQNGKWTIVDGFEFDAFGKKMIDETHDELRKERDGVAKFL